LIFRSDVEKHAGEAHELLCKAVKSKLTASEVNVASVPQLVAVLVRHPLVTGAHVPVSDLAHEVARRAAEAITKLVAKDARVKGIVRAGEGVPMLRALLERQIPRESKVQRAAAGALISLDEHGELIENIRRATESITSVTWSEVAALHDAIKRDVHTLGELAKQDQEYVDVLAAAGALNVITPLLHLGARMGVRAKTRDDAGGAPTNFADIEKEVCYTIGVMASKAKHQQMVAESGAIAGLVTMLTRQPAAAGAGVAGVGRLVDGSTALTHEVARRAADAITKLAFENDAVKAMIRAADGVATLRLLLEKRDTKVQRAAAGALITLDEHERLVGEIQRATAGIRADPSDDTLRDTLKQAVRTLAELAKECTHNNNLSTSDLDMVDTVVRAGAVEAIVPLLSLSVEIGEEECNASIGDIEKEACYAIGLLASKDTNQNRISEAGALPGLVALLKRYPPQLSGPIPPSVARRAADAVTNLAHENNTIKNLVRTEGGIPPLVALLETRDAKVQRAAASALRTLAFKNDENKNQIVECGALPMLIFMVRSEDQAIHYEAVGVIGNLVHSSTHIKRRVLDEGALQPVIGLLSSECPESQREAALLLGQFATTEPEYKVKIVQRGAVQPLIQMLNNSDSQLREMAAFALGRLAQNSDNQVGICHADGLRPLLNLLDSDAGNLQHNAAFALYGLADNEDNVPDIIREGTVQRLKDGELIVQASKDCVQKTLKRLEDKMQGRVLQYLIYLMRTSERVSAQRIAVALAHLCLPEDQRAIFMDQGGLDILLDMIAPKPNLYVLKSSLPQNQKDAAWALFILSVKLGSLSEPSEDAPLPPTPEAYLEEHFNNPELSDITFIVNQQEFYAHQIAFAHASDVFHDMLEICKVSEPGERVTVEISDMDFEVFDALMRFVYTGEMTPSPVLAHHLLHVADKYELNGLKLRCEAMLSRDLKTRAKDFAPEEMITLYHLSEKHGASTLANTCAMHALEHRISIIESIGVSRYSDLIISMVPQIRERLHSMLYRLGNS
jgi:HEAT repeat protein